MARHRTDTRRQALLDELAYKQRRHTQAVHHGNDLEAVQLLDQIDDLLDDLNDLDRGC